MMELKELSERTLELFEVDDVACLGPELMACVQECDTEKYKDFCELVDNDLTIDWLQKIYQYYQADRKNKMQDFTPACIAKLTAELIGSVDSISDFCAGSGALTIQAWAKNKQIQFNCYEYDENVLPYLIFNLCVRNIRANVIHTDIITKERFKAWKIEPGKQFSEVVG